MQVCDYPYHITAALSIELLVRIILLCYFKTESGKAFEVLEQVAPMGHL